MLLKYLTYLVTVCLAEVLIPGTPSADLKARCFVWQPKNCTDKHRAADVQLIERISKKSKPEAAAADILKHAWKRLMEKRDAPTSLNRFNQVLLLSPEGDLAADALWGAGTAYATLGFPAEAESLLLKAIERKPSQAGAYVNLAKVYANQQNDIAKAEKLLTEGLEKNPKDPSLSELLQELRSRKK